MSRDSLMYKLKILDIKEFKKELAKLKEEYIILFESDANRHFFLGAGLGMDFITYNFQSASFAIDFPLFVSGRTDWTIGKVPLFADLRLGTFVKTIRGYNNDKLFINPSIGYHCSWGRKVSLNIGAGLSMHWLNDYNNNVWKMMPSVKIGIEFN